MPAIVLRRFGAAEAREAAARVPALARIFAACVDAGASVGYLPPMDLALAIRYWDVVVVEIAAGKRVLVTAEDGGAVVGTVQLAFATFPNGVFSRCQFRVSPHPGSSVRGPVRIGNAVAWGVGALGVLVLIGWIAGLTPVIKPLADSPAMVPRTAALLVACAIAIALVARGPSRVARAIGVATAMLALVLLVERMLGLGGISELVQSGIPKLPAVETSLAFVLLGASLALLDVRPRVAQALAVGVATDATLVSLGYAYGFGYVGIDSTPIGMAPHTALGLLGLAFAALAIRPTVGLSRLLTSPGIGGTAARRLLVVAAVTILLVGVVSARIQAQGWFPAPGATVVEATASLVILLVAIVVITARLDAAERAQREARDREAVQSALLASILAQLPEPVLVIDAAGTLIHENASARAFRNAEADAASGGKAPFVLRRPTGEPLTIPELPLARAAFGGETVHGEEMLVEVTGGEQIPILVSATPVRHDDAIIAGVALFRDMRTQKELERVREEWSSVIAHDLRQPVNGIRLAAELLLRGGAEAKQHTWAARIRDDSLRLSQMIQDLLDASRLEARRMTLEPRTERLDELVETVLARLPDVARRVEVSIAPDARWLFVDGGRVIQVLGNLLSNAGKYGDAERPILVEAVVDEGATRITITNQGAGIAPDEVPRLFDRFMRTRAARASNVEGTGLGLYICKGLVEAHGGRIWVESIPGETTSFHVTLPRAPTAIPAQLPSLPDVATRA